MIQYSTPRPPTALTAPTWRASPPRTPTISPVFGECSGLPPLLIHAGEDEVLRDDALRAACLAEAAGVEVHLAIYPRLWHVWQIFPDLPQTEDSLQKIAHFLIAHLGSAP